MGLPSHSQKLWPRVGLVWKKCRVKTGEDPEGKEVQGQAQIGILQLALNSQSLGFQVLGFKAWTITMRLIKFFIQRIKETFLWGESSLALQLTCWMSRASSCKDLNCRAQVISFQSLLTTQSQISPEPWVMLAYVIEKLENTGYCLQIPLSFTSSEWYLPEQE